MSLVILLGKLDCYVDGGNEDDVLLPAEWRSCQFSPIIVWQTTNNYWITEFAHRLLCEFYMKQGTTNNMLFHPLFFYYGICYLCLNCNLHLLKYSYPILQLFETLRLLLQSNAFILVINDDTSTLVIKEVLKGLLIKLILVLKTQVLRQFPQLLNCAIKPWG